MYLLLEVASGKFPVYFVAVYVVGFLAAVTIGSIAWYNSKRPVRLGRCPKTRYYPRSEDRGRF
jgi:hypothetical protein